jgi:hypothetical protein
LTPDEIDEPFVPAELRAISRPETAHAATVGARHASEHSPPAAEHSPPPGRGARLGGDERHAPEDEHF